MKSKTKKIKLTPIPRINRRLFKIWSEKVRARANKSCEYCGKKIGEIGESGNPINKVDAHHLNTRYMKSNPLKWDISNGISLCPFHHKFGILSFHKSPVITIEWLRLNIPDRHSHVLTHFNESVDLTNREILAKIEEWLNNDQPIDYELLNVMNKPIKAKTLFDINSSSSSS